MTTNEISLALLAVRDRIDELIRELGKEQKPIQEQTYMFSPEEKKLKEWFWRPKPTMDWSKYNRLFWGKFPSVKDAFENPSTDDLKFLTQLNKAFYAIVFKILKSEKAKGTPTSDIIETIIQEANIFIYCASLQACRYVDEKLEIKFIRNTKKLLEKIEKAN